MGLMSEVFFVVYLLIGRTLRSRMPIFAYVLPVNAIAALSLCCAALVYEGAGFNRTAQGLFGMCGSWHYLWRSLYLGAVPGFVLFPALPFLPYLKLLLFSLLYALRMPTC